MAYNRCVSIFNINIIVFLHFVAIVNILTFLLTSDLALTFVHGNIVRKADGLGLVSA